MAFKKFAKGLSVASSKHIQFRHFRSKLATFLTIQNAKLASCVVEWRIHFSTALVQRALVSLRNANRQMCSITNACYFDALKYLSTLYGNLKQSRFFCKLLSYWYYQCQLACMLLPDGPVGSELCQLEKARAVSFISWRARVAWTSLVSTLPLVIFKWIAAASHSLVVRKAQVNFM